MSVRGRIFLLDDEELIITMLARALRNEGFETQVQTCSQDVVAKIEEWHPDLVLLDINLDEDRSGLDILQEIKEEGIEAQVVMLTGDDTAESAIRAMKNGAADYLTKPFNVDEVIMVVKSVLEKAKLQNEVKYLRKARLDYGHHEMVAESPAIMDIIENAKTIAAAGVPTVLITGESGTGKEVLARYMHGWLHREEGAKSEDVPYIAVNCTALPDNLIESELFGHTKWAFTDAKTDKKGMFELADGGTILLDEIGDMRADLQSKFLRVLEDRKVRRLGGKVDVPIHVTVIATTNKELKEAVENKEFRGDLYFRLSTFSLHLPPLRKRQEDIPLLARHFLNNFKQKYAKSSLKGFSREAEDYLCSYNWPGNIRELKNVVERCVVLERGEYISPALLPCEVSGEKEAVFVERRKGVSLTLPEDGISIEEVEKDLITQALARSDNNQTKAAKLLKISYDTLRYQVKKFNLK
jgi:DNA-binding NtrC family response regulator